METEGERFRSRRKTLKLTQGAVAEAAGVGLRTVQNFEGGGAVPQPANRTAMWAALGVNITDEESDVEVVERSWPADVSVFLDVMGAYLTRFDEAERLRIIHSVTRQIFDGR